MLFISKWRGNVGMRKYIQKKLIEVLNTIQKANEILCTLIQKKDSNQIMIILEEEQQSAIQVGTEIEKSEGAGTRTVQLLEEYCELIYNLSELEDNNKQFEIITHMNDMLQEILIELSLIRVKYEMAFMPYKASMWDCLESVWMEANKDENCDCYVIPIPYFDKKEDGTFGDVHYEGSQFPINVPITDYKEYNLCERHPDVLYIHNPYDQYNKVTSIHPDYYCSKIKNYTKMLVYIPYYITGYHLSDAHKLLPAYYYADKIILQNDIMIEDVDQAIPREKLVALGSPKADKILRLCKNPPEMPEEWKNIVFCKDGTKNKVVMYNISISGLVSLKIKLIKKMEYVFNIIKKIDGVILLWRPHPLFEATLKSMEPSLFHEYNRLKDRFLKEKIGIYDDTPDPATSIALCDAYIGESSSSMIQMFGLAGKPVYILNENIVEESENAIEEEMRALAFVDMALEGDEAWFVNNRYQALCKMNMETGEAHVVSRIPETKIGHINLYSYIYKRGTKLYLTPLHTDALCIYDINNHTFQKIYFPNSKLNNFIDMSFVDGEIILKPCGYDGIIRYNEKNGTWRCIDGFITEYEKLCEVYDDTIPKFIGRWKEYDKCLYMPCLQCNYVLVFNLMYNTWKYYEVGKKENSYRDIEKIGDEFWLLPYKSNSIVKWNIKVGTAEEYDTNIIQGRENNNMKTEKFGWWGRIDEELIAIPWLGNYIVRVDTGLDIIEVMTANEELHISDRKFKRWAGYCNFDLVLPYDNKLLLKSTYDESVLIAEIENDELKIIKKIPIRLSKEDFRQICEKNYIDELKIREGYFASVENRELSSMKIFMEELVLSNVNKYNEQRNYYSSMIKNMDGTAGKCIHQYVMNESK